MKGVFGKFIFATLILAGILSSAGGVDANGELSIENVNPEMDISKSTVSEPLANGGELIINGGFETGDLTGWNVLAGFPQVVNSAIFPPHSGTYSAQLHSGDWIYQSFSPAVDTTGDLTLWLASDGFGYLTIIIKYSDGAEYLYTESPSEWLQYRIPVNNTKKVSEIKILGGEIQGAMYVDDVSLKGLGTVCQQISSPGTYVLTQDITNSPAATCINIISSDVVFDGAGHKIDGVSASSSYGVKVHNSAKSLTNVTVKNLKLTEWGLGIYYDNAGNGRIIDNNASSNFITGIFISSSDNTTLENNIVSNEQYGININSSKYNTLSKNTALNDYYAFRLFNSSNVTLRGNNASGSDYGFAIYSSLYNDLTNNTALENYRGIRLYYAHYNTLTKNWASNNTEGVSLFTSTGNAIYNNYFNNTANSSFTGSNTNNRWNTTKAAGKNIIEGPYFGGNYWGSPAGSGFSDRCPDSDIDGICDSGYTLGSGNIDQLPLAKVTGGTIDSCTVISSPGEYALTKNITNSSDYICININSSNVILDGKGHTIDGVSKLVSIGVNVYAAHITNVTVKNLIVSDWTHGINYHNANNGSIANNTGGSNGFGIHLISSSNNTIYNNTVIGNSYGIFLDSSSGKNVIRNNVANSNGDTGIFLRSFSDNNYLISNIANFNRNGIYLWSSGNNILLNNSMIRNSEGIYLGTYGNNTLINNTARLNDNGIFLHYSDNNTFNYNIVDNNSYAGFQFDESSNNTLTGNIANSNNNGIILRFSSNNNVLIGNIAILNSFGITIYNSSANTIYNNHFNNPYNYYFYYPNFSNKWNTTKTPGKNIINGTYLGGNFWANPNGTGFSETCADNDRDGICDSKYILSPENIDHIPLTKVSGGPIQVNSCMDISSPGEYVLTQNITNSNATYCINITSGGVVFDGMDHTIDGLDKEISIGIHVYNPTKTLSNVGIKNLKVSDWFIGILTRQVMHGNITNITASSNSQSGITFLSSDNNTITNNIMKSNYKGIDLQSSRNNIILNNTINLNSLYGIILILSSNNNTLSYNTVDSNFVNGLRLLNSRNNIIYNNLFNNSDNAFDNGNNTWNTTKMKGLSIVGGPYLGGNYWANPVGMGFSQTCEDSNVDGICDSIYNVSSGNFDYLPLAGARGEPPVALCGPDKLKCENVGAPVQFDSSASYDPDGTIVSYAWQFGDGTTGTGTVPKHTYITYRWNGTAYQPFIVNLTVTDNTRMMNSTSQKVVIWIAGDANGDGIVNILDASIVGLKWSGNDSCADLNNDEKVNIIDASIIGLNWGKKP